ncbi:MAG TPA: hypothetical protein VNT75_33325 [Symbiobacteriaceae bacterium]|nr:hypothetical protein [Symbiobacteriaceae bacterium]
MSDGMERLLAQTLASQGRVLVDPTHDELRRRAEELRELGRLNCTFCRKPISAGAFATRRLRFGTRLEVVANLHPECEEGFAAATEERAGQSSVR